MEIEIIDSIWCRAPNREDIARLRSFMFIILEYWRKEVIREEGKKPYRRKVRKTYPKYLVDLSGYFLTGFIPRIIKYCESEGIEICWSGTIEYPRNFTPFVPDIIFRPDQLKMINAILEGKRGVLKAPTQSGKTIVSLGIVSSFLKKRVLYLAHTIAICSQVAKEFEKYGYDVGRIFSGRAEVNHQITVASRQSLSNLNIENLEQIWGGWEITILDEVHHLSSFKGQYADLFSELHSPIKIGMTATVPTKEEAKMAVEGFIGPVLDELSIQEASELGIIATPRIKLIKVPSSGKTSRMKYPEIYEAEIVINRNRNRLVLEEANVMINQGLTVLIFVKIVEHGKYLQRMAKNLFDLDIKYLYGASEEEEREAVKAELLSKDTKCVISSVIWKEGVSLPSLDCVINASGGKEEITTLQSVGRGLSQQGVRRQVTIIDFLDTAKYLAEHTIRRLHVYVENGWL